MKHPRTRQWGPLARRRPLARAPLRFGLQRLYPHCRLRYTQGDIFNESNMGTFLKSFDTLPVIL